MGAADTAAIFVKPSLGGAERKLTDLFAPAGSMRVMQRLSWSPDGRWIAVGGSLEPRAQSGVRIISVSDGIARSLHSLLQTGIDVLPAFDPRGRRLAFLRWGPVGEGELYVLNLNADYSPAAAPVRITSDKRTIRGVAWTPDGERLIYSTGGILGQRSLKEVRVASSGQNTPSPTTLLFGEEAFSLSMFRNGSLVYSRMNRDTNIWRLNLETASAPPTRIIASTLDDHTPDYSPDGKHIAFASTRSGSAEIWIAGSDGASPVRLTHMNGPATSNPRWSPDGKTILFQSSKAGAADIYALDPATSGVSQISPIPQMNLKSRGAATVSTSITVPPSREHTKSGACPLPGGRQYRLLWQADVSRKNPLTVGPCISRMDQPLEYACYRRTGFKTRGWPLLRDQLCGSPPRPVLHGRRSNLWVVNSAIL